jgi:hypothetical protein
VRKGFLFVYFNQVDHGRFLATPSAQTIADELLRLEEELGRLVEEGRRAYLNGSARRREEVVREIDRCAGRIRETFRRHFLEPRGGTLTFRVSKDEEKRVRFLQFILHTHTIHRRLQESLDDYFFPPQPGVLDLMRSSASVPPTLLAEALFKLRAALEL